MKAYRLSVNTPKWSLVLGIICCATFVASGQSTTIDSLQRLIDKEGTTTKKVELLNQLSFSLFDIDNERAGSSTKLAVETAIKIGDKSGEGWALAYQGLYFLFSGSLKNARDNFIQSLKISRSVSDRKLEMYALTQLGNVDRDKGAFDSAYYFYQQAERVNEGKPDPYYLSVVKMNKGRYFLILTNPDSALTELKRGIALRFSLNNSQSLPDAWILVGNSYLQKFNYQEAQHYYDMAVKAAPQSATIRFHFLIGQGEIYFRQGNFPKAIQFWSNALKEQKKLNYKYELSRLLYQMGEVFEEQGYYQLAIEYLTESLKISESANYKFLIGEAYYEMAWVYYRSKNLELANQSVQRAELIFGEINFKIQLAGCLNVRGLVMMAKQDYDSSLYYHQKSLKERERIGNSVAVSSSLYNLGELYNNIGEYAKALHYLWRGVRIDEKINDNFGRGIYYYQLGKTYNLMGGLDSAKYYLDLALAYAIPTSSNDILQRSYGEMADYLQKKGKLGEAIKYYKKYITISDTLYSKQSTQIMASYKTLYDVEKKEQEIELLNKDKLLVEAQAQKQQMIFFWVAAVLVVLSVLFIFYYRFSQRLKRLNAVISEKSEEIHAQSEELTEHNSILSKLNEELVQSNSQLNETLENLNKTQTQLVQSEKMASLGVLSAGIAHELNNPLNFIKGGVNALDSELKKGEGPVNDQIGIYVEIINEGVNRASAILKGLSQYSRQSEVHNEWCDVHKIMDNCLLILSNKLKHRITVEKNYSEESIVLIGNEGKLHQVFINLISNAEQAISGNGVIRITTKNENGQLSISIEDTGCGISKENLVKIGDPFFTTKPPGKGTGLGLSITYQIIESHGGKVLVTSELNHGTKFILLFDTQKSVAS